MLNFGLKPGYRKKVWLLGMIQKILYLRKNIYINHVIWLDPLIEDFSFMRYFWENIYTVHSNRIRIIFKHIWLKLELTFFLSYVGPMGGKCGETSLLLRQVLAMSGKESSPWWSPWRPASCFPLDRGGKERERCKLMRAGGSPRLTKRGVGLRRPPTGDVSRWSGRPKPWPPGFSGVLP